MGTAVGRVAYGQGWGGELEMLINIILVLISQSRINENDVISPETPVLI